MDTDLAAAPPEGLAWLAIGLGVIFVLVNLVGVITGSTEVGRRRMRREIKGLLARILATLKLLIALPLLGLGLAIQFKLMTVSSGLLAGSFFFATLPIIVIDFIGVLFGKQAAGSD